MVPQQMIMAQAPWQLIKQGFFQIAFEEDHPCYKELYYQKKKKEWMGWGHTFSLKFVSFLFHPHLSLIQSIISKLVDDFFQDVS
jgi:hypothetical protein